MVLVDTSAWVEHLRRGDAALSEYLTAGEVLVHSFVVEELACGHLLNRDRLIDFLHALPTAPTASHEEFLAFVAGHNLSGKGLGAVDVHLLASAKLAGASVYSLDKAMVTAAKRMGIAADAP
jgi:predicted nucleic acid-binding protein